mgnify:CR=1 FL=1
MSDIMKITVISDTHGIIDKDIIPHLKNSDMIIHAGDIMKTSILKQLESYSDNVIAVAGNNDLPERFSDPEDKEIISKLSKVEQFNIGDNIVTVEHGDRFGHHPSHDDLRFAYPESKLIIYGHTHNQVCDKTSNPWIVNPGAAGHTRNNDGGPCYMQIIIENNNWDIRELNENNHGEWSIRMSNGLVVRLGRDELNRSLRRSIMAYAGLAPNYRSSIEYIDARYLGGVALKTFSDNKKVNHVAFTTNH